MGILIEYVSFAGCIGSNESLEGVTDGTCVWCCLKCCRLLKVVELQGSLGIGLDKICLAKIEQNGQPKERSNSASKMDCQFCPKSKMGKE